MTRHFGKFYTQNSGAVDGVVYMGGGAMIGDAMTGAEVPAIVLRGSRDPLCLPEVGICACVCVYVCSAAVLMLMTSVSSSVSPDTSGFGLRPFGSEYQYSLMFRVVVCMLVDLGRVILNLQLDPFFSVSPSWFFVEIPARDHIWH